jgi:chemotaxis signal transduction protein
MTTMVCFRTGGTTYCLPVQATRAVCATTGLTMLPSARPGVAGILPGEPPLTVLNSLGTGGSHILVIHTDERRFGLLVDAVTELCTVEDDRVGPAPGGQSQQLVSGTVERNGQLLLIADPEALAGEL